MPREIELKLRDVDHNAARLALAAAGGFHRCVMHETNIFFDSADKSLRAADAGLRVRLSRPWDGGDTHALLTFKGPRDADALRTREAFDVACDPADQIIPLLNGLGFSETLRFEKRRETWEYGGCLVELDTLPQLGSFIEIEGPTEAMVMAVQHELGMQSENVEARGYSKLVANFLRANPTLDALRF